MQHIMSKQQCDNIWHFRGECILTSQTLFKVRVPVLSLQIVVADPIVSQDESRLTWMTNKKPK